jgi:hypothetical protein
MKKYYEVQIGKQKIGACEQLRYPQNLGENFVSLAYNADYSQAVVVVDASQKQHDSLKNSEGVTPVTKPKSDKLVAKYQRQIAESLPDTPDLEPVPPEMEYFRQTAMALLRAGMVLPQEDWHSPKMQNGWIRHSNEHNPPGYYRDILGVVHLGGMIKDGKIGYHAFDLPAGYRPAYKELFVVNTHPDVVGRVVVQPDGKVLIRVGDPKWISLDGIQFRAKTE